MIIKKGWFCNLQILGIQQTINKETYQQDLYTRIATVNSEKQEYSNQAEAQSNCIRLNQTQKKHSPKKKK